MTPTLSKMLVIQTGVWATRKIMHVLKWRYSLSSQKTPTQTKPNQKQTNKNQKDKNKNKWCAMNAERVRLATEGRYCTVRANCTQSLRQLHVGELILPPLLSKPGHYGLSKTWRSLYLGWGHILFRGKLCHTYAVTTPVPLADFGNGDSCPGSFNMTRTEFDLS